MNWQSEFDSEISRASRARARRNEGQARVCARRAAGIAAREYLARRGVRSKSLNAIDSLEQLRQHAQALPLLLPLIDHLTQPVDDSFQLPPDVDLIREAQRLRHGLLQE